MFNLARSPCHFNAWDSSKSLFTIHESTFYLTVKENSDEYIENRIYREELKESLGMIFFSPFQPEREFKVYKSCKCSQIICSRVH